MSLPVLFYLKLSRAIGTEIIIIEITVFVNSIIIAQCRMKHSALTIAKKQHLLTK